VVLVAVREMGQCRCNGAGSCCRYGEMDRAILVLFYCIIKNTHEYKEIIDDYH
jgi:hypothetical protein